MSDEMVIVVFILLLFVIEVGWQEYRLRRQVRNWAGDREQKELTMVEKLRKARKR